MAEGEQAIREKHRGLSGVLQISAPSDFGRNLLLGWLDEFRQQHPHIQLQLLINDRQADLFREPVDVALRFGPLADSSLVALPILPQHRRLICASPDYLRRHGAPQTPADLALHSILVYQPSGKRQVEWRLWRGEELVEVPLNGSYFTDDGEIARRWALAGHGWCASRRSTWWRIFAPGGWCNCCRNGAATRYRSIWSARIARRCRNASGSCSAFTAALPALDGRSLGLKGFGLRRRGGGIPGRRAFFVRGSRTGVDVQPGEKYAAQRTEGAQGDDDDERFSA